MEIRMRPQTPREQFEPDGDPYVLRGRQRELKRITENWAKLPEWVAVVQGSPGQGKSTLVRALARHAAGLGLLPVSLGSTEFVDSDHVRNRTFAAMRKQQQRAGSGDSSRNYPERVEDLPTKSEFGSDLRYSRAEHFAEAVTECGWPGAVALVDDAGALSAYPDRDSRNREMADMVYNFDEWINRGSYHRKEPGDHPTCLVLVGSSTVRMMMLGAGYSRLAEGLRVQLPVFDEPTASAVICDHLDVADVDGVRPAAVPDDWVTELVDRHRACVHDLAAAGHYVQAEAMAAARAGQDTVPANAFERIEANVQAAQAADCVRRVELLTPLERLVAHAAAQVAVERENRVKSRHGGSRDDLIWQVLDRAAKHDAALVPKWEDEGFEDAREFLRALDNRLLNAGVVDEPSDRWYSEDAFWCMGTPTLGPWLEQHRLEGLAQAAPADRWRWDWTQDIWEAFRDRSEFYDARSKGEEVPAATEPDPAETTAAPPRTSELPAPGEVPPWGAEDTTA